MTRCTGSESPRTESDIVLGCKADRPQQTEKKRGGETRIFHIWTPVS